MILLGSLKKGGRLLDARSVEMGKLSFGLHH